MKTRTSVWVTVILLMITTGCISIKPVSTPVPVPVENATPLSNQSSTIPSETKSATLPQKIRILLDDFKPQPYQGDLVYFFNRLEGDRGAINTNTPLQSNGQVTSTVPSGNSWVGGWMSLNHPIREGLPINFSAILPPQILPAYQSQITGISVVVARGTPNRVFRIELKNGSEISWKYEIVLNGERQVIDVGLPPLGNINQLVWVLDRASAGDYVVVESMSFTATNPIKDTATAAFVWSYGMLLSNWNPTTGLIRDKAKDASGEFDAIQSTGALAAATAVAEQLGVVSYADATQIVNKIDRTLLVDVPRFHGLLPHWVKVSADKIIIVPDTEWSSVDTVIAMLGLLTAQSGLGLDTSDTEQMLRAIEWSKLVTSSGISHGYTNGGDLIPYTWDVFGGESWLVELAYAEATGQIAPLAYLSPPTANGSGFIDELAWLFVPPPSRPDYWGTDWVSYRKTAADKQIEYYAKLDPKYCVNQLGLFGLSAGEVPAPWMESKDKIYQAFGVGGRFSQANDGSVLFGSPVAVPHYSAMIASLQHQEAIKMWDWLITNGYFTPLTNVESVAFPSNSNCDSSTVLWNQLKGSWNLALQTLGWGRYLAEQRNHVPILWQATTANSFLRKGYLILAPAGSSATATPGLSLTPAPWTLSRECENPDESTVGQTIDRSNAQGLLVHGQFGTAVSSTWLPKSGYVEYNNISTPQLDHATLKLRYSKNSLSTVPILIYLDTETTPRATFKVFDQGDWNNFTWTEPISLGRLASGIHSIKFYTDGQQYGVADLDAFILTGDMQLSTPTIPAQSKDYTGQWAVIGSMANARGYHTATLLRDGRVLIVGGYTALDMDTASVEIFDPNTNTFSPTGSLNVARHGHSATLLPDGRVLVIAGYNRTWLTSAEIYDPQTGRWSISQPLFPHGVMHSATLLKDGRVLVLGGAIQSGSAGPNDRAEIFDPKTNTWQPAALHENTEAGHTATLLSDGRVLIAGGMTDPSIYDPIHNSWQPAGKQSINCAFAQAVLMPDNRVMLIGGIQLPQGDITLNNVELYDPIKNVWQQTAPLSQSRYFHTATLLPDGQVLVVGGWKAYNGYESALLNTVEIFDPKSGKWSTLASLKTGRVGHTTTLLPDGRIFVTGGETSRGSFLKSAEVLGR